jgi:hypothetical protein
MSLVIEKRVTFKGITEAARLLHVHKGHLSLVLSGARDSINLRTRMADLGIIVRDATDKHTVAHA